MELPFRRLVLVLSLCCVVVPLALAGSTSAAQAPHQADRIAANADLTQTAPLAGHVPHWAVPAHDAGAVAAGLRLEHIALVMSRAPEVEAAFEQLLADQQNPASPRYHQWLTPQQTGTLYGPTQNDVDAVTAWLTTQGLQVEAVTPSRMFITFSGDAASVQNAFATEIHNFNTGSPSHLVQYAIVRNPSVPVALAPVIQGFVGLSQEFYHSYVHRIAIPTASALKPAAAQVSGTQPSFSAGATPDVYLTGGNNWILPGDFAILYDLNSVYNAGIEGSGERVAIIGSSAVASSDITSFESIAGLAAVLPTEITVPGFTAVGTTGGDAQLEATLDVDRVLGTAPSAAADLILVPSLTENDILDAINYETGTLNDPILTMSFGSCEAEADQTSAAKLHTALSAGASEGITIFVSSGDSEAAGCATSGDTYTQTRNSGLAVLSTNVICTPDVTCVGGTEFNDSPVSSYWSTSNTSSDKTTALSYIPEGVWNEPVSVSSSNVTSYVVLGGGGGPSIFWPKPSWQTGTGVPNDGVRDTPDISLSSSGHNAYLGCAGFDSETCAQGGSVAGFFGTSAAAPGMAGITALLLEKLGTRQGNLNPLLYKIAAGTPSAIHDATPTSSGVSPCALTTASICNSSTPGPAGLTGGLAGFALTSGYDQATGLGSLDVANFIAAAVVATAPTVNTLTAGKTAITTSQSITFTSTITSTTAGTPTGTVQFAVAGVNTGTPVTLSSGSAQATISFPTAGTFIVTAVYSGDSNYSASTGTTSVTVTLPVLPETTTNLTGTSGSITALQTATYTATITGKTAGNPTGTVQFYRSNGVGISAPVTVSGGAASLPATTLPVGNYSVYAVYSGDSNYAASTSSAISLTVTPVPTTTTIAPVTGNLTTQQTATFTATVAGATGTPTGTVQFYVDGIASGSAVPLSALTATSAGITFSVGTHTVTAIYSGNTFFSSSTSTGTTVTVALATFTITATPATLSLAPGATTGNTATLSYNPLNGFTGTVIQSCQVIFTGTGTSVDNPTCNPSNPTVAVSGVTSGGTITISSTTPYVQTLKTLALERTGLGGVAVSALLLLLIPATRRRTLRNWRGFAIVLIAAAAVLTAGGCSAGGTAPSTLVGTTPGTYTVTVTGTSGSLSVTSNPITLTIQ